MVGLSYSTQKKFSLKVKNNKKIFNKLNKKKKKKEKEKKKKK